jgi:flagellar biosynthesis protein FliQ
MDRTVSWADWWASRTIKFNTMMGGLFAAAIPVITQIDETTLVALGLTPKNVLLTMAAVKVIDNVVNNKLRAITTKPLSERANVK